MTEQLKIQGYYNTDTGKVRSHNEDRLCVFPSFDCKDGAVKIDLDNGKSVLFAVADGMGGTNAGEVAAAIVIETVRNSAESLVKLLLKPKEIGKGLVNIISKAHLNILKSLNDENAGMGTTVILTLLTGNTLHVAWCGDSRAYKYSPGIMDRKNKYDLPHLKILTHDHSVVWEMVRKGKLDPNEAREHELSNVITQSLGDTENEPKPESAIYTIAAGDKILICSDGLNSMLPDEFIQEFLAHDEPLDTLGNSLIEAANTAGGHDNISIILVQIDEVPNSPILSIKTNKERPEAITAMSHISGSKNAGSIGFKDWRVKEITLVMVIISAILALIYLILLKDKSETEVKPAEVEQEHNIIPVKQDTTATFPNSDTMQGGQMDAEGIDPDTIIN